MPQKHNLRSKKLEWHTEYRKVNGLLPYSKNPRQITDKQLDDLKRSLKKFNVVELPAINADGKIVAGHQRVRVLQLLGRGDEEIEVRAPNRRLTEAEFKDYLLTSNRSGGTWNFDILKSDFDIDLLLTAGFDSADLTNIFDDTLGVEDDHFDENAEMEKIKKTDIKLGDMYALGRHRLLCSDSTDPNSAKKLVGKAKIDLIDCDIPYNIGLNYDTGIGGKGKYGGTTDDKKSPEAYKKFVKAIIENALSVAKDSCHAFLWHDEKSTGMVQDLYRECGIDFRRLCLWVKDNQNPTPQIAFNRAVELCAYGTRSKPYLADKIRNLNEFLNKEISSGNRLHDDILDLFNIWLVKRIPGNTYEHPTEKSPTLHEKVLRRCTKPGDTVLDLTAGSGSFLIAAHQMKRTAYVCDNQPIFCQLIINRFKKISHDKIIKLD
jgi:DNA modification methylase